MITYNCTFNLCGKGQPGQVMYVGHGCGTARFHNIRVGVTKEATDTDGVQ